MLAGMFTNPYAGLVIFIAHSCPVRDRASAHPGGHVARAATSASRSNGGVRMARHRFSSRERPTHRPPHRGTHRGQHRHHPAGRVRRPARDGNASLLRTGVPHADAPAVPGLAGRGAFRRRLCRLSHWRGGGGTGAGEAFRRTTAGDGRHQFVSEADSARRQYAPRRPGGNVQELPPARTRDRRSRPRHPRVCRRRSQYRDHDGAADAHQRHDVIAAGDSLACGPFHSCRV